MSLAVLWPEWGISSRSIGPGFARRFRKIRGARGGDVTIERRRRDTETVCDLGDADIGIGEQRLGSLDVVVGKFWRTTSGAACAPSGGKPRLSALPDGSGVSVECRQWVVSGPSPRRMKPTGLRPENGRFWLLPNDRVRSLAEPRSDTREFPFGPGRRGQGAICFSLIERFPPFVDRFS
jgi:hypothetical protein